MKFGSVCSGIEGASMAWMPLGWQCQFVAETDKFACAVLKHRYPDVPNFGDLNDFKSWPDAAIDVLVGGTPCQSFSVAGLRKGLDDPRGNLMLTYLAIAARYRPRWLVWENVPGVLSSNKGRDFGSLLTGLAELGYGFAYRVLDAQYFGLAQRRARVFVVGHLGDWRCAAAVLFERASLQGDSAPSRQAGQDIAPPIAGCSNGGGANGPGRSADDVTSLVSRTLMAKSNSSHDATLETYVTHTLTGEGHDASDDGSGRGTPLVADTLRCHPRPGSNSVGAIANTLVTKSGRNQVEETLIAFSCKDHGADAGELAPTLRAMGHDGSHANAGGQIAVAFNARQDPDVYGDISGPLDTDGFSEAVSFHENQRAEVSLNDTAGAINSGGGKPGQGYAAVMAAMAVRRLMPWECEILQGFPRDHTLVPYPRKMAKDGPRYKVIGNSFPVTVINWLGRRIEWVEAIHG